jgi:hypothetical protein
MDWDDVVDVLTAAAAFDRRKVGQSDVTAWQVALAASGVTSKADAIRAVSEHYAATADYLIPAHVADRVRAMRLARVENLEDVDLVRDVDPDDPHWTRILQARRRAVLDGTPVEQAKAIPARQALRAIGSAS